MKSSSAVEIVLDLRQYSERVEGAHGFIDLWQSLTPALEGQVLNVGKRYNIAHSQHGNIGITLLTVPQGHTVFRSETPFAIHSVLEPPLVRYTCTDCRKEGRRQYMDRLFVTDVAMITRKRACAISMSSSSMGTWLHSVANIVLLVRLESRRPSGARVPDVGLGKLRGGPQTGVRIPTIRTTGTAQIATQNYFRAVRDSRVARTPAVMPASMSIPLQKRVAAHDYAMYTCAGGKSMVHIAWV